SEASPGGWHRLCLSPPPRQPPPGKTVDIAPPGTKKLPVGRPPTPLSLPNRPGVKRAVLSDPTTNVTGTPPAPAPAAAPPRPAAPPKPAPAAKAAAGGKTRRFFLFSMFATWTGVAWTAFTGSLAAMTLGSIRFLFPNANSEPPSKFKAGDAKDFEEGKVV